MEFILANRLVESNRFGAGLAHACGLGEITFVIVLDSLDHSFLKPASVDELLGLRRSMDMLQLSFCLWLLINRGRVRAGDGLYT